MARAWIRFGTLAAVFAALNGHFNWASTATQWLCLLLVAVAVARFTNLRSTAEALGAAPLWRQLTIFAAGALLALFVITAAEVDLAYLYQCSEEFKDSFFYTFCVRDFGPYYTRPEGLYAPGERQVIAAINYLYEAAHDIEHFIVLPVCTENFIRVDEVMESPKLAE
jgi:hypothetical protein